MFIFLAVTGPVFSPKYIHPILPFLIIAEAIALVRVIDLFLNFSNIQSTTKSSIKGIDVAKYLVSK